MADIFGWLLSTTTVLDKDLIDTLHLVPDFSNSTLEPIDFIQREAFQQQQNNFLENEHQAKVAVQVFSTGFRDTNNMFPQLLTLINGMRKAVHDSNTNINPSIL